MMDFVISLNDWLLGFFLFGVIFCGICITYTPSQTGMPCSTALRVHPTAPASFLEDRPKIVRKEKVYLLTTPLMITLTCLLEDAPEIVLKGQAYELAVPLLTPLSCLLEDVPSYVLRGQAYLLATPLACLWKQGWLTFYHQKLAQRKGDYWHWRDKPFADQVLPELSQLLQLKEPQASVKEALRFWSEGKKDIWSPESLSAFWRWHERANQQMDMESLQSIYYVCFGIYWEDLQSLLSELNPAMLDSDAAWWKVLGVKPLARPSQVEQSYKKLVRLWHPDLNAHPLATEVTAHVNKAYEYYRQNHPLFWLKFSSPITRQAKGLISVKEWLKSRFLP